jgi:uncharacterized protein
MDSTGTLDTAARQALETKLTAFEGTQGSQIVVLVVPTTAPEAIASYAQRVGDAWKIGRKEVGDGLLIVVAKDDRKLRIEVAKALEGAIPDLMAKRVIDQAIAPRFRVGDFAGGIDAGLDQIMGLIRGEALPAPLPNDSPRGSANNKIEWQDFIVVLFFAFFGGGVLAPRIFGKLLGVLVTGVGTGILTLLATESYFLAGLLGLAAASWTVFLNRYSTTTLGGSREWDSGSGAGGQSSSSSGGFNSGGGGNFGGGGASGGW